MTPVAAPVSLRDVADALRPFAKNVVSAQAYGGDGHVVGIYVPLGQLRKARVAFEALLTMLGEEAKS